MIYPNLVEKRSGLHQHSFARGLDVLISIAQNGQSTVPELAEELDIPQSTVYRYVRSLRDYALVEESGGVYLPGWRLLDLSGHHLTHARIVEIGTGYLRDLTEQTSETSVIAIRAGSQAICLRQSVSPNPDSYAFRVNELLPLYAGAGQRVLLAYAPQPIVDIAMGKLVRHTQGTPDDSTLRRMLEEARKNGYAVSRGEYRAGAVAISVPVFASGEIACSLTLAGPAARCSTDRWLRRSLGLLRDAASRLGRALDE